MPAFFSDIHAIATALGGLVANLFRIASAQERIAKALEEINEKLSSPVVGIEVTKSEVADLSKPK